MPILTRSPINSPRPPSELPPPQRRGQEIPQFVCLGFDDNGYSGLPGSGSDGALSWLLDEFRSLRNHDGSSARLSFYVKTDAIEPGTREDPALPVAALRQALKDGHELGSHTWSHPHGVDVDWQAGTRRPLMDEEAWTKEIMRSITGLDGLADPAEGLAAPLVGGFRTPYLHYSRATFAALDRAGFAYDSSIEENWQKDRNGSNSYWPYTLGEPSPGERWASGELFGLPPQTGGHPLLWELPISTHFAPPDELCQQYGLPQGFRKRLEERCPYYDAQGAKLTGLDWNFWFEFHMDRQEFAAVLKYTLDLRLASNRAPLIWGGHSDIYSPRYDREDLDAEARKKVRASVEERKLALMDFVKYATSKPGVRLVSMATLLEWMRG